MANKVISYYWPYSNEVDGVKTRWFNYKPIALEVENDPINSTKILLRIQISEKVLHQYILTNEMAKRLLKQLGERIC